MLVQPDELGALLGAVRRSSWRWECQGNYAVDGEDLRRWLAGEPTVETDDDRAWVDYVRRLHTAGIPFERVRMLTEPLTDYLRWMLDTTDRNVDAGEDIRWIEQRLAVELGMPGYDFYILDDERVVIMRFDDTAALTVLEVVEDRDTLARHRAWRDLVWPHAIRHADYPHKMP
ncbi:MAG: hypothetical protein GEU98_23460 [Pseudonocardiaceae bacterium]|nr:hypothetical protein [Pseudonocardiaceae bacterium]